MRRSPFARWIGLAVAIAAGLGSGTAIAAASVGDPATAPINGTWRTLQGTEITISPCATGYCGILSWIVVPKEYATVCADHRDEFAAHMVDLHNPDPGMRTQSLIGMQLMTISPGGNAQSYQFHLYNSEKGEYYDGTLQVLHNDTLRLGLGCVMGLCVAQQDWPRVPVREGLPDFTCAGGQ